MHLITDRNHQMVQRVAAFLEEGGLPPEWAVKFVRDCERGEAGRLTKAVNDQMELSALNAKAQHRGVDGLGQVQSAMAPSLAAEIRRRYADRHVIDDPKYMRKLEREYGFQFKPNYQRKARVVHPGLKGFRKWHAA